MESNKAKQFESNNEQKTASKPKAKHSVNEDQRLRLKMRETVLSIFESIGDESRGMLNDNKNSSELVVVDICLGDYSTIYHFEK